MNIKPGLEEEYKKYVEKNSNDDYSKGVIDAEQAVGKALDEGKTCEEAHDQMFGMGLTGFMAGCVASSITHFHVRGEEFRKFWNAKFGVPEDKPGVVNPAIVTIEDHGHN